MAHPWTKTFFIIVLSLTLCACAWFQNTGQHHPPQPLVWHGQPYVGERLTLLKEGGYYVGLRSFSHTEMGWQRCNLQQKCAPISQGYEYYVKNEDVGFILQGYYKVIMQEGNDILTVYTPVIQVAPQKKP